MQLLLAGLPFDIRALDSWSAIEPPEETGLTFEDNARLKAEYYARATGLFTVADDSGLEIDALDGRPGVLSARYPGETYGERFELLFREMAHSGRSDRGARFVCAIALASPEAVIYEALGSVEGQIVQPPRGSGGFGYDPIFFHPPSGLTMAELPAETKAHVSHRGVALRQLRDFLERAVGT